MPTLAALFHRLMYQNPQAYNKANPAGGLEYWFSGKKQPAPEGFAPVQRGTPAVNREGAFLNPSLPYAGPSAETGRRGQERAEQMDESLSRNVPVPGTDPSPRAFPNTFPQGNVPGMESNIASMLLPMLLQSLFASGGGAQPQARAPQLGMEPPQMQNELLPMILRAVLSRQGDPANPTQAVRRGGPMQPFHTGGPVNDFTDMVKLERNEVPAVLEQGEVVINKKAAQVIGPDKLNNLNQIIPRYHTGTGMDRERYYGQGVAVMHGGQEVGAGVAPGVEGTRYYDPEQKAWVVGPTMDQHLAGERRTAARPKAPSSTELLTKWKSGQITEEQYNAELAKIPAAAPGKGPTIYDYTYRPSPVEPFQYPSDSMAAIGASLGTWNPERRAKAKALTAYSGNRTIAPDIQLGPGIADKFADLDKLDLAHGYWIDASKYSISSLDALKKKGGKEYTELMELVGRTRPFQLNGQNLTGTMTDEKGNKTKMIYVQELPGAAPTRQTTPDTTPVDKVVTKGGGEPKPGTGTKVNRQALPGFPQEDRTQMDPYKPPQTVEGAVAESQMPDVRTRFYGQNMPIDWKYVSGASEGDAMAYLQKIANTTSIDTKPGTQIAPNQELFGALQKQYTESKQPAYTGALTQQAKASAANQTASARLTDINAHFSQYTEPLKVKILDQELTKAKWDSWYLNALYTNKDYMNATLQKPIMDILETEARIRLLNAQAQAALAKGTDPDTARLIISQRLSDYSKMMESSRTVAMSKGEDWQWKKYYMDALKYEMMINPDLAIMRDPKQIVEYTSKKGGFLQGKKQYLTEADVMQVLSEVAIDPVTQLMKQLGLGSGTTLNMTLDIGGKK